MEPEHVPGLSLTQCGLEFPGQPYSAHVLKVGYSLAQPDGTVRADGTITLLTGPQNILVDTGGPWDRDFLLRSLEERGLSAGDVHVVVGTHGHSDHVGNLGLFPGALLVVGFDVCRGDTYVDSVLARGDAYSVDEHISILPTPGHSGQDVSVQVTGVSGGTLLVAGDLFENYHDELSWRELSLNPQLQQLNRQRALQTADVIIPGHGAPFRVTRGPQEAASVMGRSPCDGEEPL
ncbi:metallo-beta-lactamase domain-containing protein 1 [Eucyclogobius newberryi]|uniref:metallo-beta-lactamase domain-containing protein 1 n=1 Tax=Eucyclogobius newberryi TaxID=166745 RepID=UPI003B5B87F2